MSPPAAASADSRAIGIWRLRAIFSVVELLDDHQKCGERLHHAYNAHLAAVDFYLCLVHPQHIEARGSGDRDDGGDARSGKHRSVLHVRVGRNPAGL